MAFASSFMSFLRAAADWLARSLQPAPVPVPVRADPLARSPVVPRRHPGG